MTSWGYWANQRRPEQFRSQGTCDSPGCKNPGLLDIRLSGEYGPPSSHTYCQLHALELMPGFLALVATSH